MPKNSRAKNSRAGAPVLRRGQRLNVYPVILTTLMAGIVVAAGLLLGASPARAQGFTCQDSAGFAGADGGSTATALSAVACGFNSNATSDGAAAFGFGATASGGASSAYGYLSEASGASSSAYGFLANASRDFSVAIGAEAGALAESSIAIGHDAGVGGLGNFGANGIAIGNQTRINSSLSFNSANSTAVGSNSTIFGGNSGAFGTGHTVIGNGTFVLGGYNTINGSFAAGNGDNINVVGSNNTVANAASAAGSSIFGSGNTVNAANALVMANTATVTGTSGVAIGNTVSVTGNNAVAIGNNTSANFDNSVAIGNGATTTRANQQAFGTTSTTYTMPGITSAASRAAQNGTAQIVTTDSAGNLATASPSQLGLASTADIASINSRLDDLTARSNKAFAGVAMAFAMAGVPTLLPTENLAVTMNWGTFQSANGLALNAALRLADNIQINGGIGYGLNEKIAGGRVGLRFSW